MARSRAWAIFGQARRAWPFFFAWEPERRGLPSPPLRAWAGRGAEKGCTNQTTGEKKMGITELFLVGVGLSMDAFAVAICRGLSMKKLEWKQALLVAVFFGGFQALMPTIGWVLGKQFEQYIV